MVVSAPAPSRRRSSPRRRSSGRRRRSISRVSSAYSKASIRTRMGGVALGGLGVGLIEKTFPNLPSLPVVGRKGAIALGVYMLQPKEKLLQDVGIAAAAIAGYEFGKTGTISGPYDDSEVFTTT